MRYTRLNEICLYLEYLTTDEWNKVPKPWISNKGILEIVIGDATKLYVGLYANRDRYITLLCISQNNRSIFISKLEMLI